MSVSLNKTITNVSATAGTWTVTVSDTDGIYVGGKIDVAGLPTSSWNINNETVDTVNTTAKTVTYSHGSATVASTAVTGVMHLHVNWIDATYVETLLGYTPTGDDLVYLEEAVEAASDFAYRRRAAAGYTDLVAAQPSADVRLGTGLYAMALYRERGSVDSFASFTDTPTPGLVGSMGQVMRLLGINRAVVA